MAATSIWQCLFNKCCLQYLFSKCYLFTCISTTLLGRYQILGEIQLLQDNKAAKKMVESTVHFSLDQAEVCPLLNISTHSQSCHYFLYSTKIVHSSLHLIHFSLRGLPPPWARAVRCSLCQCWKEGSPALSCFLGTDRSSCLCQGYCP